MSFHKASNTLKKPPPEKPVARPQAMAPKSDPIPGVINKEERFSNPKIIQSFLIINSELEYIENGLRTKGLDPRLLGYLKEAKDQIISNKRSLESSYQSGKLTGRNYLLLVDRCMTEHQNLFKEAKATNDKTVLARLAKRLDLLTKEKTKLKQNPDEEFPRLVKFINPNMSVDPNKFQSEKQFKSEKRSGHENKFGSEGSRGQGNAPIKVPKLTEKINEEFEDEKVDSLPLLKKIEAFRRRHKQYHNLAMYYSKNMKDRKEAELNNVLIPKLQQGKKIVESLCNGEDIKLAPLFASDFQEITPEIFQGDHDFHSKLEDLQSKLKSCIEEESSYYKTIFDIAKFRPKAEESKKKKAEYEKALKLMECIVADPWIPIPAVQIVQESRLLTVENKELDHTEMKFSLKQFLNSPHKNCYISYTIDINGRTFKEVTEPSDDHFNLKYEKLFKIGDSRKSIDKELYKKTINFLVHRKKLLFGTEEVGTGHIELKELLSNNRYEGKAQVTSKDKSFSVEFGIYLRDPLRKEDKKIDVVKLLKVFPKFDINEGVEEYLKQPVVLNTNKQPQPQAQPYSTESHPPQQNQPVQEPLNTIPEGVNIDNIKVLRHSKNDPGFVAISQAEDIPAGLTKNDVLNPEDCEKCPCLSFVEQMVPRFQKGKVEFVKEYDREAAKYAEACYNNFYKQQLIFPTKIENGMVSAEDYKGFLEEGKRRDEKLLEFYQRKKAGDWALFVKIRLAFLENEIRDLEQGMAEG